MITSKSVKGQKYCRVRITGTVSKDEPLHELSCIVASLLTRYDEDDICKAVAVGMALRDKMGGD